MSSNPAKTAAIATSVVAGAAALGFILMKGYDMISEVLSEAEAKAKAPPSTKTVKTSTLRSSRRVPTFTPDAGLPEFLADSDERTARWLHESGSDPRVGPGKLRKMFEELTASSREAALLARLPADVLDVINRDVPRSCPEEPAFATAQGRTDLRNVLAVYALEDPEVGYVQGMNFIAAYCLLATGMKGDDAYVLFYRLMQAPRYHMRDLFKDTTAGLAEVGYIAEVVIQEQLPDVAAHFARLEVGPAHYFEWWITIFTIILPPEELWPVWDAFIADGWPAVFRVLIVLLKSLEPHLQGIVAGADFSETIALIKSFGAARQADASLHRTGAAAAAASAASSSSSSLASAGSSDFHDSDAWTDDTPAVPGGGPLALVRATRLPGERLMMRPPSGVAALAARVPISSGHVAKLREAARDDALKRKLLERAREAARRVQADASDSLAALLERTQESGTAFLAEMSHRVVTVAGQLLESAARPAPTPATSSSSSSDATPDSRLAATSASAPSDLSSSWVVVGSTSSTPSAHS